MITPAKDHDDTRLEALRAKFRLLRLESIDGREESPGGPEVVFDVPGLFPWSASQKKEFRRPTFQWEFSNRCSWECTVPLTFSGYFPGVLDEGAMWRDLERAIESSVDATA
jgi:hypothetical protein